MTHEDLIHRAKADAQAVLQRYDPKERSMIEIVTCPQCGNDSLVVGAGEGKDKCYFCDRQITTRPCSDCGTLFAPDELLSGAICQNCFDYKVGLDG
jgi:ribosomal protein L32